MSIDLRRFDLNLLRALDILLEEKNVTRAAERLFITQQSASGALQRLRRHFGDELLVRVGRHMELTPRGYSLVTPVRETLLCAERALQSQPQFDPQNADTCCRMAMSDYGVVVFLPSFLRLLNKRAPKMQCIVEPVMPVSFERLARGDLDLCISANDPRLYGRHQPDKHIQGRLLFSDDFVCVVDPKEVDLSAGMDLDLYQKLRHNTLTFGEGFATIVEQAWLAAGLNLDIAVTAPTFSAQILMLPGTDLVATAQRRLANTLAPSLGLAIEECPLPLPRLNECLAWHERAEHDSAMIFLRDTLCEAGNEAGSANRKF